MDDNDSFRILSDRAVFWVLFALAAISLVLSEFV